MFVVCGGLKWSLIFCRSEKNGLTSLIRLVLQASGSSSHRMTCGVTVTSILVSGS